MPAYGWDAVVNAIRAEEYRRAAEVRQANEEAAQRQDVIFESRRPEYARSVPVDTGPAPISATQPTQQTVSTQEPQKPIPPLPPFNPWNPAYDVKRRTAIQYGMTPEATRELYNTPTRVYYTNEPPGRPEIGPYYGYYTYPEARNDDPVAIDVWRPTPGNGRTGGGRENTMMHEFAHQRHFEMDPWAKTNWALWGVPGITQGAQERFDAGYGGEDLSRWQGQTERYAYQAEAPWEMTPEFRNRYYPNLWEEDAWR